MSRILVAEDDAWVRRVVQATLALDQHDIRFASDGQETLDRLSEAMVDLLVLDLGMPRLSGLAVLDRLREEHPDLPILVLTGLAGPEDEPDLVRRGARAVLAKPVQPMTLRSTVQRLLTPGRSADL